MKKYLILNGIVSVLVMTLMFTAFLPEAKAQRPTTGTAKTANKTNPVPKDWIYVYEKKKGYGFYVPKGTTGGLQTIGKLDLTVLKTPDPLGIDIFVLAYKDKTLTKEDLLNDALEFLEGLGQKVTPGEFKGESDEYAVVDADTVHPTLGKGKLRILVGTDVTDNYIMIIGANDKDFNANEATIDAIWGSFEMWSAR